MTYIMCEPWDDEAPKLPPSNYPTLTDWLTAIYENDPVDYLFVLHVPKDMISWLNRSISELRIPVRHEDGQYGLPPPEEMGKGVRLYSYRNFMEHRQMVVVGNDSHYRLSGNEYECVLLPCGRVIQLI